MLPKLLTCYQALRNRVSRPRVKHSIVDAQELLDFSPYEGMLKDGAIETELHDELQQTRVAATTILEGLVKRSESDRRRMELIFDSMDDCILLTDKNCKVTAANLAARQLFDVQTNVILGNRINNFLPEVYHPDDVRREYENYKAFLESQGFDGDVKLIAYDDLKQAYSMYLRTQPTLLGVLKDYEYRRTDGVAVPVRCILNLLTLDPFTEDFGYLFVIHDLTESKKAAAEMQRLQTFTSSLMSITPIPLFNKDTQLRFTFVNAQFQELVRLPEEEILGKSAHHVFDAESARILTDLDTRALSSVDTQHTALSMKTLHGSACEARVFSRAVKTGEQTTGIAGSILLGNGLDSKMRNAVFEAAAKSIIFFDSHLFVTGCNDEFVRLSGLEKSLIIGMHGQCDELKKFLPTDTSMTGSDLITVDGKRLSRTCTPVLNADGSHEGLVCVYFIHNSPGY